MGGETPVEVPGEVSPVAASSAAAAVVQEHQPSVRIPGEVIADAIPGGRVPKPVGQPGVAARATAAAKIRTLRALSGMKVKIVGTWERIPSQETMLTRTIVVMAVLLMLTGVAATWGGVALQKTVREKTSTLQSAESTVNALSKKTQALESALAEANRKLNAPPWWKFWASW